jgi:hypothetical protein
MRDREVIDSELRLIATVRRSIREHGGEPSSRQVDELLDERLAHCGRAREFAKLVETYARANRLLAERTAPAILKAGGFLL